MSLKKKKAKKRVRSKSKKILKLNNEGEAKKPFDYAFLNLTPGQMSSETKFWIKIHISILAVIYMFFSDPQIVSEKIKIIIKWLSLLPFGEILYYLSLVCTALMALDIYEIEKLKDIEKVLKNKVYSLKNSFVPSIKHAMTISNRTSLDVIDWYINTTILVYSIYILYKNQNLNFSLLDNLQYFYALLYAILIVKIISVISLILLIINIEIFLEPLAIICIINYQKQIFAYFHLQADSKVFIIVFLYLMFGYACWSIVFYFESRAMKFFGWICAVAGAFPYLLLKVITRCIPYLIFYPWYLIIKLAVLLKAKSLLRHIGFILLIILAVLSRLISH